LISRETLDRSSRLFAVTGLAWLPLATYEIYLGLTRSYYILQADGYHSLFDSVTALLYAILIKVAYTRSKKYTWRLYNVESMATILVSIFVVYLTGSALLESLHGGPVMPTWTSRLIWVNAAMSAAVATLEARYARLLLVRSDVLHASVDAAVDLIAGGVVVGAYFRLTPLIMAVIFIVTLYNAVSNSLVAVESLLGLEVHASDLRKSVEAGLRSAGIRPLRVYVARAGSFYLVQAIIALPPETTLAKAYRVKKRAAKIISSMDSVLIADVRVVPSSSMSRRPRALSEGSEHVIVKGTIALSGRRSP